MIPKEISNWISRLNIGFLTNIHGHQSIKGPNRTERLRKCVFVLCLSWDIQSLGTDTSASHPLDYDHHLYHRFSQFSGFYTQTGMYIFVCPGSQAFGLALKCIASLPVLPGFLLLQFVQSKLWDFFAFVIVWANLPHICMQNHVYTNTYIYANIYIERETGRYPTACASLQKLIYRQNEHYCLGDTNKTRDPSQIIIL